MRILTLLLITALITGCETLKIATTSKIEPSGGPTDSGVLVAVHGGVESRTDWGKIPPEVANECSVTYGVSLAPEIWVPILAKFAFDIAAEKSQKYVEGIKTNSSKSLAYKAVISRNELNSAKCLMVSRAPIGEPKKPSSIIILKLDHKSNALRFSPIYAAATNSISITKCINHCSTKEPNGKLNLVVAIGAIASIDTKNNDTQLRELGTATTTVINVPLRGEVFATEDNDGTVTPTGGDIGTPSSLIAIPNANVPIQLSIAITEMGDVAGDPDIALGEIKAAHAIISEGALAELKAHYERKAAD